MAKILKAKVEIESTQLDHYQNEVMKYGKNEILSAGLPLLENIRKWTAKFEDGCEADIKLNTSEDDVWTEGVLFDKDGSEITHTDVCDYLEGEWHFTNFNTMTNYVVVVSRK